MTHLYMPVLKLKRAEKEALEEVDIRLHQSIVPLFEVVERRPKPPKSKKRKGKKSQAQDEGSSSNERVWPTISEHLERAFDAYLVHVLGTYPRCLIDPRDMARGGDDAAQAVFERAEAMGINFTPVTGFSRALGHEAAMAHRSHGRGIALRVCHPEIMQVNFNNLLEMFLIQNHLAREEIDLIIDLDSLYGMVFHGALRRANQCIDRVPLEGWRTLTLSSTGFADNLRDVKVNTTGHFERLDWQVWSAFYRQRERFSRMPAYSDFGIQHPVGVENFVFSGQGNAAPSIRWADSNEAWFILRGEGNQDFTLGEQYEDLARELVGRLHINRGRHCEGCVYAARAAVGDGHFAQHQTWRKWGTIHHITTVMNEISRLSPVP